MTSLYLSVAAFKATIDIEGTSDTTDDDAIYRALAAASQALDLAYGRTFTRSTGAKDFKSRYAGYLEVVDLISVTAIAVDIDSNYTYSKALLPTDYTLFPYNAPRYQRIEVKPLAVQSFWPGYMVRVTGDWGYVETWGSPAVEQAPPSVVQACQILAHRLLRRKDAPFGVLAAPEMGEPVRIAKSDPDVVSLMGPFDRTAGQMAYIA